jgi:preprotein translocase subunit SecE
MNREMKRAQAKAERQQKAAGLDRRSTPQAATRRVSVQEKRKRTGPVQFLREVRLELKKVDWPTRTELWTYSTVVLVTITVVTAFVFGVDFLLTKFVFPIFNN